MEAIVTPVTWPEFPSDFRELFQRFRSPEGERLVLEQNIFVEGVLPGATQRQLSRQEMDHYRQPFANPSEDRRPTLSWPRNIPIDGEPADAAAVVNKYSKWLADSDQQLEGSHLLSAAGRIPNTEALTPEAAGIRLNDRGFIEVDEYLETSVPGVYAMGDLKGGPAFTHLSYDDYRILHANLITHEKASTRDRIVPYTVFMDPQLGRVGMTEREARAQGRAIRVAKLPMSAVVRAIETGETRGFMKAIVDADSGQILGCAVLGSEGGEIMTMVQVAMLGKLTYTAMADAIFTHPLLAEGLNTLFAMFDA